MRTTEAAILILALVGVAMPADAGVVYSNTSPIPYIANPGRGGIISGTGVQQDVLFDDVPIPDDRLFGRDMLEVTRVTVGVGRIADAPPVDATLYWATATTTVTHPDTQLDAPGHLIGTGSVTGTAPPQTFITELVVIGDGVSTLFTVPLNRTMFSDFGTFLIGVQFSNDDMRNGWRLTGGPDLNADWFWQYDTDRPIPEVVTPERPQFATFYIEIEGRPVPEPATLGLLAPGALLVLRRRQAA
jgi:hypothetical protein